MLPADADAAAAAARASGADATTQEAGPDAKRPVVIVPPFTPRAAPDDAELEAGKKARKDGAGSRRMSRSVAGDGPRTDATAAGAGAAAAAAATTAASAAAPTTNFVPFDVAYAEYLAAPDDTLERLERERKIPLVLREALWDFEVASQEWGWRDNSGGPLRCVEMQGDFTSVVKICDFDASAYLQLKQTWRKLKDGQFGVSMAQMERFIDRHLPFGPLRNGIYGLVQQSGDIALGFNVRARAACRRALLECVCVCVCVCAVRYA